MIGSKKNSDHLAGSQTHMDRPSHTPTFRCSTMRSDRAFSFDLLLHAEHNGKHREPCCDADDRQNIHEVSFLWCATDYRCVARSGVHRQSQTGRAVDAFDGIGGDCPGPSHQQTASGTFDLSLSVARKGDHKVGRGMVRRHNLRARPPWIPVFMCNYGLVQPVCSCLDVVEHAGNIVLSRSTRGRLGVDNTGNLQHRSGISIHGHDMDRPLEVGKDTDQHGWTRPRFRQRVCRTIVENGQI
jgi:hypothetical protein